MKWVLFLQVLPSDLTKDDLASYYKNERNDALPQMCVCVRARFRDITIKLIFF